MMIFYFGKITNRARNLEIKIKKNINNDKIHIQFKTPKHVSRNNALIT